MFTGLVQNVSSITRTRKRDHVLEIALENFIKKVQLGDSVAVDGICLTLEKINPQELVFALGQETLQVTGWNSNLLKDKKMNIETSLKMGDSVGGQWLTGHIDGMASVKEVSFQGENQSLIVTIPEEFKKFLWKKGFIALNGVSLTIHEIIETNKVRLGIIPETLKKTNLKDLKKDSLVTFEVCYIARTLISSFEASLSKKTSS